ncbi:MAG TPA: DUF5339 family protein [Bordetella sp.]|jgi:hypothetical protein|nr:DUF5339 family protein [Bordetella sp.]
MHTQRKPLALMAVMACAIALAGCDKKQDAAAPASSSGSTASIPAECETYVQKVNACVNKLGQDNPAMAAIKQQLDAARAQWSAVADQSQLAAQCKQSNDMFSQSASQIGC